MLRFILLSATVFVTGCETVPVAHFPVYDDPVVVNELKAPPMPEVKNVWNANNLPRDKYGVVNLHPGRKWDWDACPPNTLCETQEVEVETHVGD